MAINSQLEPYSPFNKVTVLHRHTKGFSCNLVTPYCLQHTQKCDWHCFFILHKHSFSESLEQPDMTDSPCIPAHNQATEAGRGEGKYWNARKAWEGIELFKWAEAAQDSSNTPRSNTGQTTSCSECSQNKMNTTHWWAMYRGEVQGKRGILPMLVFMQKL